MQPAITNRLLDRLTLALVILAAAVPVTLVQTLHPGWRDISHLASSAAPVTQTTTTTVRTTPAATTTAPTATPAAAPAATTPTPVAAPAPAAAPATPSGHTVTTNSFVHMRSGKSVNTPILFDLDAGSTVTLRDDADAQWQGVTYQGKNGYIFKSYIAY